MMQIHSCQVASTPKLKLELFDFQGHEDVHTEFPTMKHKLFINIGEFSIPIHQYKDMSDEAMKNILRKHVDELIEGFTMKDIDLLRQKYHFDEKMQRDYENEQNNKTW